MLFRSPFAKFRTPVVPKMTLKLRAMRAKIAPLVRPAITTWSVIVVSFRQTSARREPSSRRALDPPESAYAPTGRLKMPYALSEFAYPNVSIDRVTPVWSVGVQTYLPRIPVKLCVSM